MNGINTHNDLLGVFVDDANAQGTRNLGKNVLVRVARDNSTTGLRRNPNFEWWLQSFSPRTAGGVGGPDKPKVKQFAADVQKMPKLAHHNSFGKLSLSSNICTDKDPELFTLNSVFLGNLLTGIDLDAILQL